jgi:hypothetical protein
LGIARHLHTPNDSNPRSGELLEVGCSPGVLRRLASLNKTQNHPLSFRKRVILR